jgi:hypothetical protein
VVFQGEGYGLGNPTLTKFIAMAAIIQAAASYTTSGDTINSANAEFESQPQPCRNPLLSTDLSITVAFYI